jgi:hypothetical protein
LRSRKNEYNDDAWGVISIVHLVRNDACIRILD